MRMYTKIKLTTANPDTATIFCCRYLEIHEIKNKRK